MSQSISIGRSSIATVNPYTNEVVREFPPMSPEAIDHAVEVEPLGDSLATPNDSCAASARSAPTES
jgi:hypothetical protein